MNLLIVGSGKGSWAMRGHQLGAALGARVVTQPTAADWRWAECIVLVKRAAIFAEEARATGAPIVWDALDFWRQPHENRLGATDARQLLRREIGKVKPALVIGATEAMAADACGAYLPHHSWHGLTPADTREHLRVVAYEGNPAYLGTWKRMIEDVCVQHGASFVVNPPDIRSADVVVALREGQWDGWACREWKSGVKLANAIAAGRPVITQASAAMREIAGPGSVIESPADLGAALATWSDRAARDQARDRCEQLAPALRLPAVAERFRALLARVRSEVAA